MGGFINYVAMYLLVLFLLLMYGSIVFALAKKSGITRENILT